MRDTQRKIFVAGHTGLVGSAIVRRLKSVGYTNILCQTRAQLDLTNQEKVLKYLNRERPDVVIDAAAKVGGIHANSTFRSEFLYENLQMQNNLIWGAHKADIDNFVFLGSSCIYPREAPQPMQEGCLLQGVLEPTNRPYALSKISGLELIGALRYQYDRNYFSIMPTNLFGPGDNFHPENSHVIPALIRRVHSAKVSGSPKVTIWGSGNPQREFMYMDDCADGIVYLMEHVNLRTFEGTPLFDSHWCHINLGSGIEVSIREIAETICKVVGFTGEICFDTTMPDGMPRKLLDLSFLRDLGWNGRTDIEHGLRTSYEYFLTL